MEKCNCLIDLSWPHISFFWDLSMYQVMFYFEAVQQPNPTQQPGVSEPTCFMPRSEQFKEQNLSLSLVQTQ